MNVKWHGIEYKDVNKMKEHYANQNGPRTYSMLSPSDVPTHFSIKQDENILEIEFRYMNESEKTQMITVLDNAIDARVGRNSKKIYYIKINLPELKKLTTTLSTSNKKRIISEAAKNKVKSTSYSAIKEIYNKYIRQYLDSSPVELAF